MKTIEDMVRTYENGRYAFSDFLGLAEQSDYIAELRSFPNVPYELFGGYEGAERVVLRIGNEEHLGYTAAYPMTVVEVRPKNLKFADKLTHRDFLGALINLGIERRTIGDILIDSNIGYVWCLEKIAPYILENLTRVCHTSVECTVAESSPSREATDFSEKLIQVSSMRADLIVSKAINISRSTCKELFEHDKIFVNGRLCNSPSQELKEGELISVRGHGRIRILNNTGLSHKGKINLKIGIV